MKDYLIDFCTYHGCDECAYHCLYHDYLYRCIVMKILKVHYPWSWDENIELDNYKVTFLEGI